MTGRVVIVGSGFGGLVAARALADGPVELTVVDRRNHHLFQPLLYQVATAGLNPSDIAYPIRSVLRRQANARVLLGEATAVDAPGRAVVLGDGERDGAWALAAAVYPGFESYVRFTDRKLPVAVLERQA